MANIDRRFLDVRLIVDGFSTGELTLEHGVTRIKVLKGRGTVSESEQFVDLNDGAQFVVARAAAGGVFEFQNVNDIAEYSESDGWKFVMPGNIEIFDKIDHKFWRFNNTGFVEVMSLATQEEIQQMTHTFENASTDIAQMKGEIQDILDDADRLLDEITNGQHGEEYTEVIRLSDTDIMSKMAVLSKPVRTGGESQVRLYLNGLTHIYGEDYIVQTIKVSGADVSCVQWNGLSFDGLLCADDVLTVTYPFKAAD